MTIGGALSDLNNLLKADDIPIYYKPSIKAVMDTIALSRSENPNKWIDAEVLDKIRAEIDNARFIDKDTRIAKNALASGLEVAMQIIDKYMAESEDKE